ncbi:4-hydroxyphenylpyruvate dioxygenase, partial [Operophtera brumata]
ASSYFVTRFGFKPLAVRESTEDRPVVSYAITIVFESPTTSESEISKDLSAHGDFVKDVAFEVNDLDELVQRAKDGGAEVVKDVTVEADDDGALRYAVLRTYGDNTHTLIDRSKFWCVDYKHDLVPYSCINSGSVINKDETVLLSLNEAAKGLRPTSKASDFVKALGTSGVEHMRNLKSRGAEIVSFPSTYYSIIRDKLKASPLNVTESLEALQENGILIDFDERGYMLQAFTKHVQVRPTVFIEIIQRRNHRGFGSQNYKWVFEAIELLDKTNEDK